MLFSSVKEAIMRKIITTIGLVIKCVGLIASILLDYVYMGLLTIGGIIIRFIIAPIVELASFGFIRIVRVEDKE